MSAAGVLAGQGHVRIGLDDKALYTGLKAMQVRLRSLGQQMTSTGATMFGAGAAGLAPLIPAIMKASDAAEGYNRFLAVMGQEAKATDAALAEMGKRIGRNQVELRDTASSFQGMFVGLGMTKAEAAKLATQMTELSLDFASFNNLADSDASERFLAGLSGSSEVFDRFGINIKEAALKAKLAEMGIKGTATELQKTQARIAIITESMARQGATKDATTTAGSFANQLKAIKADAAAAAQEIGASLIPVLQKYMKQVREILSSDSSWLKQNPQVVVQFTKLAAGVAAAGAAMFAVGKALSAIDAGVTVVSKLAANWKALSVVGVAAGSIYLAKKYIYDLNGSIQELNDQLHRTEILNLKIDKARQQRDSNRFDTAGKSIEEVEQLVKFAELEAAGARRSQEGAATRAREASSWFKSMTGNKILAGLQDEAKEAELVANQYGERASSLRKQFEEMKRKRDEEAEQVKKTEAAKRAEYEKTQRAKALAERFRGIEQLMPANLAKRAGQGIAGGLDTLRAKLAPLAASLRSRQESMMSIASSTAATGLAARTETIKKTEDLLGDIASNTKQTIDAIKNMPGLKLG